MAERVLLPLIERALAEEGGTVDELTNADGAVVIDAAELGGDVAVARSGNVNLEDWQSSRDEAVDAARGS